VVDDEGKTHVGKDLGKAQVKAKLLGEQKGKKVKVFKYRPKTGYAKSQGHRQLQSLVEIEDVVLGRRAASKKAADEPSKSDEPELEAAAAPAEGGVGEEPSAGVTAEAPGDTKAAREEPEAEVEGSGEPS
jgi:large subunit ribosomal protein L21